MIWKNKTHEFTATRCLRTGQSCLSAAQALRTLSQAASLATKSSHSLEMDGTLDLPGCHQGCQARFLLTESSVHLFCGVSQTAALQPLMTFAEMLTGNGPTLPGSTVPERPCALLVAARRDPYPEMQQPVHPVL